MRAQVPSIVLLGDGYAHILDSAAANRLDPAKLFIPRAFYPLVPRRVAYVSV